MLLCGGMNDDVLKKLRQFARAFFAIRNSSGCWLGDGTVEFAHDTEFVVAFLKDFVG